MEILKIIDEKRLGKHLSQEEIKYVISEYTAGNIPDYQMSSLLMAICTKGFNFDETVYMTLAMKNSGKVFEFHERENFILDKHSTGGVSDSTSLIVLAVLTELGYKMVKVSGRGLGFTGGTADKLDVIKGLNYNLKDEEIKEAIKTCGGCILSNDELTPADKKIYSLRDTSGTVESIPLITASVVSKKLATGAHGIVLDVKCGHAAFMKNNSRAVKLAKNMLKLLRHENVKATAMITDMNRPLGFGIGCAYEIADVVKVLNGEENNLRKLSIEICVREVLLQDEKLSKKLARAKVAECIDNGNAKKQLLKILKNQGSTIKSLDTLLNIDETEYNEKIYAPKSGFVKDIDALALAEVVNDFGGGRKNKDDKINHNVGIELHIKPNQKVKKDALIATIHHNNKKMFDEMREKIQSAFKIGFLPKYRILVHRIIKQ